MVLKLVNPNMDSFGLPLRSFTFGPVSAVQYRSELRQGLHSPCCDGIGTLKRMIQRFEASHTHLTRSDDLKSVSVNAASPLMAMVAGDARLVNDVLTNAAEVISPMILLISCHVSMTYWTL